MFSLWYISKAILIGFFTGFIASVPLGPSGLESVNRSISRGFRAGFHVSLGAVLADVTYLSVINLGLFNVLNKHKHFEGLFWIISGIVLIIFNKLSSKEQKLNSKSNKLLYHYKSNGFLAGFLITFLNPTTPSLWIALSGTVLSIWRLHGKIFFTFAMCSMIIGSIAWFCLLNILVSKGFRSLKANYAGNASKFLNYVLFILGILFILWGVYNLIF